MAIRLTIDMEFSHAPDGVIHEGVRQVERGLTADGESYAVIEFDRADIQTVEEATAALRRLNPFVTVLSGAQTG